MKLNKYKTECLLWGSLKGAANKIFQTKVNENSVKSLGIYIGHNKIECHEKNWMNYQRDIKNLLHSWKSRKLTIFGKSCIVNTWAISNKKDRIRRNTLEGDKLKGRINIVNIQSKFKKIQNPKILSCNHELKDFFESFCRRNNFDVNYLLNTTDSFLNEQEMLHYSIPNFYREIMTYFNEY